MEERRPIKENIEQTAAPRTQSRISASSGLLDVQQAVVTVLNQIHAYLREDPEDRQVHRQTPDDP